MVIFDNDELHRIYDEVNTMFQQFHGAVSEEGYKEAKHYLDHDEIEIAFEYLCLALLEAAVKILPEQKAKLLNLAYRLGLDTDDAMHIDTLARIKQEF